MKIKAAFNSIKQKKVKSYTQYKHSLIFCLVKDNFCNNLPHEISNLRKDILKLNILLMYTEKFKGINEICQQNTSLVNKSKLLVKNFNLDKSTADFILSTKFKTINKKNIAHSLKILLAYNKFLNTI